MRRDKKRLSHFNDLHRCVAFHVCAVHSDQPYKMCTLYTSLAFHLCAGASESPTWIFVPICSHTHCIWTVWCDCAQLWCVWKVFSKWRIHWSKCRRFSSNTSAMVRFCQCARKPHAGAVDWIARTNWDKMNTGNLPADRALEDGERFSLEFEKCILLSKLWNFQSYLATGITSKYCFERTKWTFKQIDVDFVLLPHMCCAVSPHFPFVWTFHTLELPNLLCVGHNVTFFVHLPFVVGLELIATAA